MKKWWCDVRMVANDAKIETKLVWEMMQHYKNEVQRLVATKCDVDNCG